MKIGIFGGSFNPVHNEHIELTKCFVEEYHPDKFILMPTYQPHYKSSTFLTYEDRVAMLKLAFPNVEICHIERDLGFSYAVETIGHLSKVYEGSELCYVVGGDNIIDIFKWREPEKLFGMTKFYVARRGSRDKQFDDAIRKTISRGADVIVSSYRGGLVSSSLVRACLILDVPIDEYVPIGVRDYLGSMNLVFPETEIVHKLSCRVKTHTFEHIKRTVVTAFKINAQLNLPFYKVFVGALLHDVDKNNPDKLLAPNGTVDAVIHQFSGAKIARDFFGVADNDILDAIKYHTTGKSNMTQLGKLIFVADMIEYGRCYPEVDNLRRLVYNDFEEGFRACIKATYEHLLSGDREICPLTKEAYSYYIEE